DLLPCEVVERHADDPQWVDQGIVSKADLAAQSAAGAKRKDGRLPDLVALGACISRENGSLGVRVVFGNVGLVSNPVAFALKQDFGGNGVQYRVQTGNLRPGALLTHYVPLETTDKRMVLDIDSDDNVAELDETNNYLNFEIKGRPEGGFNWPDCPQHLNQVADWEAMMRARKG